ncbi:MAG TPA: FAD-binding oxidoreductase [Candidatus Paceibacterota bacterium]|nr:FAD-binding oxidoreductase [Candidatus Paceibacterota bacterium]HRZ34395.1 FAD-binding oxidoreductase [Candidatus Paceibacterota bacterium]
MYKYKVLKNELLVPTVRSLSLVPLKKDKNLFAYKPGQYGAISLHDGLRPTTSRCFSIISTPTNQNVLEFSMRVNGKFTRAIKRLKEGDRVDVRGPFGNFIFDKYIHHDLVMFAGGIGITPFISMLRYADSLKLDNKIRLLYSCSDQNNVPFLEELKELEKINPNLKVNYFISKGDTDKILDCNVNNCRVDEGSLRQLNISSNQSFMICGPIPYIKSIKELLTKIGVNEENIMVEDFSLSSDFGLRSLISWPMGVYALTGAVIVAGSLAFGIRDYYVSKDQQVAGDEAVPVFDPDESILQEIIKPVDEPVDINTPSSQNQDIVAKPSYNLAINFSGTGGGNVNGNKNSFSHGEVATLTAIPDSNSVFSGWTNCDNVSGTICSVSMTADKNVTAIFDAKTTTPTTKPKTKRS